MQIPSLPVTASGQINEHIKVPPDLRQGQIISARILQKLDAGLFELLFNNHKLKAIIKGHVETGQKLKLAVESEHPRLILKPVSEQQRTLPVRINHSAAQLKNLLLRNLLPEQPSMKPLLASLKQIHAQKSMSVSEPGRQLTQQIREFIQTFPKPAHLSTAKGLKHSLEQSGLFHEVFTTQASSKHQVAQPQTNLKAVLLDLKQKLIKLETTAEKPVSQNTGNSTVAANRQRAIVDNNMSQNTVQQKPLSTSHATESVVNNKTAPGQKQQHVLNTSSQADNKLPINIKELLPQIEQSINRIQLNQSQAVVIERQELPVWNFSLPIADGKQLDMLDLIIYEEQKQSADDAASNWHVELEFEFDPLGLIKASIRLQGDEISANFWAEHEQTRQLMKSHINILESKLSHHGLNLADISFPETQPESIKLIADGQNLVDVHL